MVLNFQVLLPENYLFIWLVGLGWFGLVWFGLVGQSVAEYLFCTCFSFPCSGFKEARKLCDVTLMLHFTRLCYWLISAEFYILH